MPSGIGVLSSAAGLPVSLARRGLVALHEHRARSGCVGPRGLGDRAGSPSTTAVEPAIGTLPEPLGQQAADGVDVVVVVLVERGCSKRSAKSQTL